VLLRHSRNLPPSRDRRRSVGFLLAAIVVVTIAALVGVLAAAYSWNVDRARAEARVEAGFHARQAADAVESSMEEARTFLAEVPSTPALARSVQDPRTCTLGSTTLGLFREARLELVRSDGSVACSSREGASLDRWSHAGADWLDRALAGRAPVTSRTLRDPLTGRSSVVVAVAVLDGERPVGAMAYVLHTDTLAAALGRTYGGPDGIGYTVADVEVGLVRSSSVAAPLSVRRFDRNGFAAAGGTFDDLDGVARIDRSATVPSLGWRVHAGIPVSAVTAGSRTQLARLSGVVAAAMVALAIMAWFVHRRIVRPLRRMTAEVVALRGREHASSMHVGGPSEVSALADEFNELLRARAGYETALSEQALHDDLTSLPNRALLRDRLERALRRMDRGPGQAAVLFIDLDRFKVVNDSLGHPAGDALLRQVAQRIAATLRASDTIGRFGGDEFLVICEDIATADGAVDVARRIEAALDHPFAVGDGELVVSASIGIAVGVGHEVDPDELVRRADVAMYRAKERHGASHEVFDEDLLRHATGRLQVEQDLHRAIAADELEVHYQPVCDLRAERTSAVEALVRWRHPDRGLIPPDAFIPVAEETGMIDAVGRFVLRRACADGAALVGDGHDLDVAVNVCVAQLTPAFAGSVSSILEETGLPPERLVVEITESAIVNVAGSGAALLDELRRTGVRVAIDDFGTGYSSLSYLQELSVDAIKIDRSFVARLGRDDRSDALVNAIVALAGILDLRVVAEGVETNDQVDALRRFRCTHAQGFLFSKPVPIDDLRTHLGSPTSVIDLRNPQPADR
jgi:diguanylate cyclase (GGDEF)-like protein